MAGRKKSAKETQQELRGKRKPIDPVYTVNDLQTKAPELATKVNQLKSNYNTTDDIFPQGEVSAYSFGQGINTNLEPGGSGLALSQADNFKKPGVGGNAEFWLRPKKKEYGPGSRIELMPARRSFTPVQGQMVPGAGAGLEIRVKSNIARLPIPGSRPVIQHMGIAEETISFVGAFCGFDIPQEDPSDPGISYTSYNKRRLGNAYDDAMNLLEGIRAGWELEMVMRWNSQDDSHNSDIAIEYAPQVRYTGYIRNFCKEFATAQRVYYRVEMVVSNRESTILDDSKISAPSMLRPTAIKGGVFGLDSIVANVKATNSGAPSTPTFEQSPSNLLSRSPNDSLPVAAGKAVVNALARPAVALRNTIYPPAPPAPTTDGLGGSKPFEGSIGPHGPATMGKSSTGQPALIVHYKDKDGKFIGATQRADQGQIVDEVRHIPGTNKTELYSNGVKVQTRTNESDDTFYTQHKGAQKAFLDYSQGGKNSSGH